MKPVLLHFRQLFPTVILVSCLACGGVALDDVDTAAVNGGDGSVLRVEEGFDEVLPENSRIEKVASGLEFADGAVWVSRGGWEGMPFLLFTDTRGNALHRWVAQDGGASEFIGSVFESGREDGWSVGPAGMVLDRDANLIVADQGGRRVARITPNGQQTTLVEAFEEKRLNSPNGLTWGPDGSLYFTDPPFGLREHDDDSEKELADNGVYRVDPDGQNIELVARGQSRPNGLGFSPDGTSLFVSNSDPDRKNWVRYPVSEDGTVGIGRVFYDVTSVNDEGLPDGLVLDQAGRLYGTGPGGVWVFSPDGVHLGTIRPVEVPANVAWGDDGSTLYMTARTGVYRIRLSTKGFIP